MAEYFRDAGRPGRAAVHRQHLPLRAGRLRGLGAARAACRRRSATSRRWRPRWAHCRSGSPRPSAARSPRSRRSTCRPTTTPTPAPATTFAHLDATIALGARDRRERASTRRSTRWPRPRASSTRRRRRGALRRRAARCRRVLQRYKELQDIIAILGMEELSRRGQADRRARAPASSASSRSRSSSPSSSPAAPGKYVPIAETVRGFQEILDGKHDDLSETPSTWRARSTR